MPLKTRIKREMPVIKLHYYYYFYFFYQVMWQL
uniref:Uncharacterized protein n=1 Tax=Rhizophora mucronata TaxID=61149 RepID=A0A2P2PIN3_RHIMU